MLSGMTINILLEQISINAFQTASSNKQTIGEKNYYYITLEQLDRLLRAYEQAKL